MSFRLAADFVAWNKRKMELKIEFKAQIANIDLYIYSPNCDEDCSKDGVSFHTEWRLHRWITLVLVWSSLFLVIFSKYSNWCWNRIQFQFSYLLFHFFNIVKMVSKKKISGTKKMSFSVNITVIEHNWVPKKMTE